jgi:1-acyl-sn-glycerol-3-phosphate acyltransferase
MMNMSRSEIVEETLPSECETETLTERVQTRPNWLVDIGRLVIHPLVIFSLKQDRKKRGFNLFVSGQHNIPKEGNFIAASNHGGELDIAGILEALKQHKVYVMLGEVVISDPKNRLKGRLNGSIELDRFNAVSCKNALDESITRIKNGQSILNFFESSWNIQPSVPVQEVHGGPINMSMKTSRPILPIAAEVNIDRIDIMIEEPIYIEPDCDYQEAKNALRDQITTMRWELWNKLQEESEQKWTRESARKYYEQLMRSKHWTGHPSFNKDDKDKAAVKRKRDKIIPGGKIGYADPDEVVGYFPVNGANPYSLPNIYEHFAREDVDNLEI